MGRRFRIAHLVASVALVTSIAAVARDSAACGNAGDLRGTPAEHVERAERAVNEGKIGEGVVELVAPTRLGEMLNKTREPWYARTFIVSARATVRTGGGIGIMENNGSPPSRTRAENLLRAEAILKEASDKRPDDVVAQTDLAEARSRIPDQRRVARVTLEGLESKDIMASAWGYAALTRLRDQAGDGSPTWLTASMKARETAPREISFARCTKMGTMKVPCNGEALPYEGAVLMNSLASDYKPGAQPKPDGTPASKSEGVASKGAK